MSSFSSKQSVINGGNGGNGGKYDDLNKTFSSHMTYSKSFTNYIYEQKTSEFLEA